MRRGIRGLLARCWPGFWSTCQTGDLCQRSRQLQCCQYEAMHERVPRLLTPIVHVPHAGCTLARLGNVPLCQDSSWLWANSLENQIAYFNSALIASSANLEYRLRIAF